MTLIVVILSVDDAKTPNSLCSHGTTEDSQSITGLSISCCDVQREVYSVSEVVRLFALLIASRDVTPRSELLAAQGRHAVPSSAQIQEAPFELTSHSCRCLHCCFC